MRLPCNLGVSISNQMNGFVSLRQDQYIRAMKKIYLLVLSYLLVNTFPLQAQGLTGVFLNEDKPVKELILLIDGYASYIRYSTEEYQGTWGGPFELKDERLLVQVEYDDQNKNKIGLQNNDINWKDGNLSLNGHQFKRLANKSQQLDGLWRITGRKQNEQLVEIPKGDRKTIKLLIDGYFQWIAINPAKKEFHGTGGGLYSFSAGNYTENILFFSRDNSRVGAKLEFQGSTDGKIWQHQGLSSKGDPIYEIWTREQ